MSFKVREKASFVCLLSNWGSKRLAQRTSKWHHTNSGLFEECIPPSLFPTTKYHEKRKQITGFQEDEENLYDAWERYNLLIKRCPEHKFLEMKIALTFTDGLKPITRMFLDASVVGTKTNKTAAEI
jgi:hypothetical protein